MTPSTQPMQRELGRVAIGLVALAVWGSFQARKIIRKTANLYDPEFFMFSFLQRQFSPCY